MKKIIFLCVFVFACMSNAVGDVACCTINSTDYTVKGTSCLPGSVSLPAVCTAGVCDKPDGSVIKCAKGLIKCCVYSDGCPNTNNLQCKCVKERSECNVCAGVSTWQYATTENNGCKRYVNLVCDTAISPTMQNNVPSWISASVTSGSTYSCAQNCYLDNGTCKKCPGDRKSDWYNTNGVDSCGLNCTGDFEARGDECVCKSNMIKQDNVCVCSTGTYKDGESCVSCPDGGTSNVGATGVKDCYLPAGSYQDEFGYFETTNVCEYNSPMN